VSEQTRLIVFDASTMAYDENVTATAAIVQLCHEGGLDAEAELGEIGGKDGVHAAGARTRPEQARAFATTTGVDALAVAVGTLHAMTERRVALDFELISARFGERSRCPWCCTVPQPFPIRNWSGRSRLA
jgi:fructose-bisphosphate aldolase class II